MKKLLTRKEVKIPENVEAAVDKHSVVIKGPRGQVARDFKHALITITHEPTSNKILVDMWMGKKKQRSVVMSIASAIENMITGVTRGYYFKMKNFYKHFPIHTEAKEEGKAVEVWNFMGRRKRRVIKMPEGCTASTTDSKSGIEVAGIDLDAVALTCARIHQSCLEKNKDEKKFLDGVYLEEKTHFDVIEETKTLPTA
eukprot:TRINITY_DN8388_c0_g2_i1.p1 TRINITY_DN8388_c0_g2~~TRINITY_DN8388_c0_g2_i1.p1  ORF type:complete len:198 (+),score=33.41 TRINITY_DN8388_c0_g2_i1:137-730(+)